MVSHQVSRHCSQNEPFLEVRRTHDYLLCSFPLRRRLWQDRRRLGDLPRNCKYLVCSVCALFIPPDQFPRASFSQGAGNESEDEEDDQTLLKTLESRLLDHDPTFSLASTYLARSQQQNSLLAAFLRGDDGSSPEGRFDAKSLEQSYQLHLNVERSRVPEVWFQPSIAGLDTAGVGEIIEHVLRERSREERKRVQQVSLVSAGSDRS